MILDWRHPTMRRESRRLAVLLLLAGATTSLHAQEPQVTRGPYLQLASTDSVTVRWRTDVPASSRVLYGSQPGNLTWAVEDPLLSGEHAVTIDGLDANTRYYYSIGTLDTVLAGDDTEHFFETHPQPGSRQPFRAWILGDSGTADAQAQSVRDAYYAYTGATHTNLWLMLGDNAYASGTDEEYQAALFDMFPTMLRKSTLWPTLGNHDATSANSPTQTGVYYDIFTLPGNGEAGGLASGTEAYYSFDHANVHFVVLDSHDTDRSPGGAMMTWLAQDLAATDQDWIVATWHHPPYSKGGHDSDVDPRMIEMRENAVPILDDYGADLTFVGHSHNYERSHLMEGHYGDSTTFVESMNVDPGDGQEDGDGAYHKTDLGGTPHSGIVHTVAGCSGRLSAGPLDHPAMYVGFNVRGSVVLDVDGSRLDVKFLDNSGNVLDYFTLLKGAPPLADFSALPRIGRTPLTVAFTDRTANLPNAWSWDFDDDGAVDSQLENPTHTFVIPGLYSVRELVSNGVGTDELLQSDFICVTDGVPPPVTGLRIDADRVTCHWDSSAAATSYDVLRGDLLALRAAAGDLSATGIACAGDNVATSQAVDDTSPAPGEGLFFLVRGVSCAQQQGSYDADGPAQEGSRDLDLVGLSGACGCDLTDDADADAICDSLDYCPTDPENDADADALCAGADNCPVLFNPLQENVDGDTFGDVCDVCPADPDNDIDADSICGDVDNCPLVANPGQQDLDADGLGEICDPCPADPFNDGDGDGSCAGDDNCALVFNPGQSDVDLDGVGDLCDACPLDPDNDSDTDGHCANLDNCPTTRNPFQADPDADGVGELCDNCPGDSNPMQNDFDLDGAGDACDCRPTDPAILPPEEVAPLMIGRFSFEGAVLSWPEMAGATRYSVTRSDLSTLGTTDLGPCLASNLTATAFVDALTPAPGQGYFYLVQGVSRQCGPGTLGFDTSETTRVNTHPDACASE